MHKLKLDNLKVESFATEGNGNTNRQGTVRAHDATVGATCEASCLITCAIRDDTCQISCGRTCLFTCERTCDFTCVDVNTCHC